MNRSIAQHDHEKENNGAAMRYIAFGTLVAVWSGVWLLYMLMPDLMSGWAFVATAAVLSGLLMTFAGFKYIQLNKQADRAEIDEAKELAEHERQREQHPQAASQPTTPEQRSGDVNYDEYRVDPQLSSKP